ncbi:MAG: hypothetical protein BWX80_03032 [Candidatus Hydrogenedentes bacterium ADurb.Bin101]|nr:hypothetical protein [Candidatus Hydrogenedentota bacterium]OQC02753.1 MAG: hypothetical protein BWX80_03032 [Candidatus Hydrogenedentes bacterium ADurb.Bin101]
MKIPAHDRRTFLKYAAAGTMGFGLQEQVSPAADPGLLEVHDNASREGTEILQEVVVRVEAPDDPLVSTAFNMLKDRVELRCPVKVTRGAEGAQIVLALDPGLAPEAFRLGPENGTVRITGGAPPGLLYGVGKFLRTSGYGEGFLPSSWTGVSSPQGTLRGMYFATHFHNWHQQASDAEVSRYLEDLALWGINAIMVAFPMINLQGWDDPQMEAALSMMKRYARAAHALGLQFTTGLGNTMFIGTPDHLRATPLPDPTRRRGNSGHPVCPSLAEGHAYILDNTRRLFENLADVGLDIVCFWPYDEGGCACAKCAPWGCNGYLRLSRDLTQLGREYFPKLKTVLSTWMFDTPPEGEWQGLADALAKDPGWVDYILADSHEDFPRYPLDHGVPGGLPLLNFPEISMWGNSPWGGFGANPLPARFQRLWDQVKGTVTGGFPYSEGIYEDMNKAVVAQCYWDRDRAAADTLREYMAYEFGPGVEEQVLEIIGLLESAAATSYRKEPVDPEAARRACAAAEAVEARLPDWGKKSWRWELLRLRTVLDRERFGGDGLESPAAEAALLRLMELYHCQLETDDPYHHRVRPPLKRALSRNGTL